MIRIAIVDDHPATADGLAALLAAQPGLVIVGTAGSLATATELLDRTVADVAVVDIQIGGRPVGFDLLRRDRGARGPAVILFSSFDTASFHARAVELGARGFLAKTTPIGEVVAAIRTVAAGGTAFSAAALDDARGAPRPPSGRELQVIALVAAGRSNEEIGTRLRITEKSVESHLRRLFARYGLASRTELSMLAVQQGWVDPPTLLAGP